MVVRCPEAEAWKETNLPFVAHAGPEED